MFRLAWFFLRAALWLGLASLFLPGFLPRDETITNRMDGAAERAAQDTLTPADRVASWRAPRVRKRGSSRCLVFAGKPNEICSL